jgi:RHS repeat-associated protein
VSYAYNTAARLTGVTNNGQVDSQNPATPTSAMHYNAFGGLTTDTLGDAEVEIFNYDKRLRMQSYTATINSPNYYSTPITLYSFSINSFAPNGDILSANDSANGNWTYSYDPFNRLVGANQNNGAAVYSYVYDRFGNRWQQNGPTNTFVATFTGNNQSNPQNNNRMDGYTHDAAGNIMSDGLHNYTFDAENRMINVDGGNTAAYVYDADGHRVQKTSATGNYSDPAGTWIFFYDQSGRWVQKFNSPGNTFVQGHIFAAGRHLASVGGWTTFSHSDWVGTERLRLAMGGIPYQTESCASLPFGDGLNCTGSDVSNLHFTGKERDAATGLDYFGARYNSSSLGRFMSADWSDDPDPVPYADLDNPQTLNLYAYTNNNPVNAIDDDGHDQAPAPVPAGICGGLLCELDSSLRSGFGGDRPPVPNPDADDTVPREGVDDTLASHIVPPGTSKGCGAGNLPCLVGDHNGEQQCSHGHCVYWNDKNGTWDPKPPDPELPLNISLMLRHAGTLGQTGLNYSMVATAPNYLAMGGIVVWDSLPAAFTDAFNGINNNPVLRIGKGWKKGKEIWRIASGGRWGKGGPKLPWHVHLP